MATITKTASLYWGYDTYWNTANVAAQGAWNATGSRTGAIYLPFGTTLATASITQIEFTATFGSSGWGAWDTGKLLSFYSSNYQTLDTSKQPQTFRKSALGTLATSAYGNTVTHTLNSSSNATLFNALKNYFEGGNTLLCLYNGENSNVSDYQFSDNYLTMTALTMTVTYSPKYTLTLGKGTGVSSVSGGGTYVSGTTVSASATMSTGYDFVKWTTGSSSTSTQASTTNPYSFSIGANTTLYAHGTLKTYAVTYNANGGSGAPGNQIKTYGIALTLSSVTPTRTGYTFAGWNTKSDGSGTNYSVGSSYSSNAPLTLYAKWTVHVLTVKYNANGGTQASGNAYPMPYTTTANYGNNYNGTNGLWDISTFGLSKAGHVASVWNTKADGTGYDINCTTSYTAQALATACGQNLANGNVTLNFYPKWVANGYKVTYNGNGNTGGSTSDTSHTYGVSSKLATNGFSRTGHTFASWNTKADGSGTTYAAGASVSTLASSGTVTLYAIWTPWTYTVKYNANGGSGTMSNSSHTYGVASQLRTNTFTRANYTFLGWSTSSTGAVVYANGAPAPQNISSNGEQINLYAIWSQNSPWSLSMTYVVVNNSWHMF